jgi:hypothetical protein
MNFDFTTQEIVELDSNDYQRAKENSDRIQGQDKQWDAYINTLALLGFEKWLHSRRPEVSVLTHDSTIWEPYFTQIMPSISQVNVEHLTLCLVGVEGIENNINIPIAMLDLPNWYSDFYVIIEVLEEQGNVIIQRFIRADKLTKYRDVSPLTSLPDWSYQVPISWFEVNVEHLLFSLPYLTTSAIAPSVPTAPQPSSSLLYQAFEELRSRLSAPKDELWQQLLSQLSSPERDLWKYLSWEQGAKLLNSSSFLEKLYQWQTQSNQTQSSSDDSLSIRVREMLSFLIQPAINTAFWLRGELDQVAQNYQVFQPRFGAIDPFEKFEKGINLLRRRLGLEIPNNLTPNYIAFEFSGLSLYLAMLSWPESSTTESGSCWSLLVILGTQQKTLLPAGMQLKVSNLTDVLRSPTLDSDQPLLYAIAQETIGKEFKVTITYQGETFDDLPPYTFQSDQVQVDQVI